MSAFWTVAQCQSQCEGKARQHLMRAGYLTYAPRIYRLGRVQYLFATYVFVFIAADGQWYRARWSPHVTRVLMDGERPAKLSDDIIASIRGREVDGFVSLPRAPSKFHHGQRVRVTRRHSPFEHLVGVYDGMSGIDRERVLLDLLGRRTVVTLPSKDVAALG